MGFHQTAKHRSGKHSHHQIGLVRGQFGDIPEDAWLDFLAKSGFDGWEEASWELDLAQCDTERSASSFTRARICPLLSRRRSRRWMIDNGTFTPSWLATSTSVAMMESGAILWYLAEKTGKFLPKDARKRYDVMQWLIFQMAHVGPMFGQANHFNNYSKEKIQYAIDRYNNESIRLYRVLDNRARDSEWMGCDEYTIADMAIYPWAKLHGDRGITEAEYPNFMRWFNAVKARPAVQRNDKMAPEIRARMNAATEGKQMINLYDTKDNAARLASASKS